MKKRLLFLISLTIVCFVTFSNAAFAWFSKQYNPSVDGLRFNVATQENIMISTTGNKGSFNDNIAFSEFVDKALTLTPLEGVITENNISILSGGYEAAANVSYIKMSLYFHASNDMNVYLAGSTSGTVVDPIKVDNSIADTDQVNKIIDSLRIGFLSYNTIETPSSNGIDITYSPFNTNVYSVNEKTDESYTGGKRYETFTNIGYTEGIQDDVVLLTLKANTVSKMDVFIWIEDKDVNCIENIASSLVQINLRFLGVNIEESGN